jgi:hypothetical protein
MKLMVAPDVCTDPGDLVACSGHLYREDGVGVQPRHCGGAHEAACLNVALPVNAADAAALRERSTALQQCVKPSGVSMANESSRSSSVPGLSATSEIKWIPGAITVGLSISMMFACDHALPNRMTSGGLPS